MPYCTTNDVIRACGYDSADPAISATDIADNITDAEGFINDFTGTVYWSIEDSGTATGGDTTTVTDSGATWTTDAYIGYTVWIYEGTNSGEYREITDNDGTNLTVSPAFDNAVDTTDKYRIVPPSIRKHTGNDGELPKLDGNGRDEIFLDHYPIRNIQSLTVDSTSVTPSTLYVYNPSGQVVLGSSSEVSYFADNQRQLVAITYFYGEYPITRTIQRLCAVLAALKTLTSQIGGTFDDFTSISLPEISGSLGEPYTNIRATVHELEKERDSILGKLVRKKPYIVCG